MVQRTTAGYFTIVQNFKFEHALLEDNPSLQRAYKLCDPEVVVHLCRAGRGALFAR